MWQTVFSNDIYTSYNTQCQAKLQSENVVRQFCSVKKEANLFMPRKLQLVNVICVFLKKSTSKKDFFLCIDTVVPFSVNWDTSSYRKEAYTMATDTLRTVESFPAMRARSVSLQENFRIRLLLSLEGN